MTINPLVRWSVDGRWHSLAGPPFSSPSVSARRASCCHSRHCATSPPAPGIPGQLAWLWPMIVDGTILQATMAVVALAGHQDQERSRRYFWIVLSSSAAVSVGANALHAVIPGSMPLSPWLAAAIAVVAPVSLLATTHGLSLLIRVPRRPDAVWWPVELPDDAGAHSDSTVAPSHPTIAVAGPTEHPEHPIAPVAVAALQPWESLAEVIASREGAKDVAVAEIASVLHLSYERELPHHGGRTTSRHRSPNGQRDRLRQFGTAALGRCERGEGSGVGRFGIGVSIRLWRLRARLSSVRRFRMSGNWRHLWSSAFGMA